ncbi:tesmin [Suncus etruscus]|uniref:tesmin n=1 Tax=Suncus etruscus TaxID=109475 RepID=UPI002110CC27|nr:tesmin [Suncus etruscus]
MEEAPLLGPDDAMVGELFGADGPFADEAVKPEDDAFQVFPDPLLQAFSPPPPPDAQGPTKAELLGGDDGALGDFAGLPELHPLEDPAVPAATPLPPAYNVHFLSSLLGPHRSPAVLPLGTWPRDSAAAPPAVRMIPVEIKEVGGTVAGSSSEEATFQNTLAQEPCCKFPSSQEADNISSCSHQKDCNPMVICQLKDGTQMLCIDNSGAREQKALHLVPQYQDQNNYLQSEVPKPMTTLVGRFLPVPAKLNLINQQLDNGALPSVSNGSAFPSGSTLSGPPKITLAGYCDCFASGGFCNNCNCNNCCNNLRHELERVKAIKACLDRNPEAFQPKVGDGQLGAVRPRHNKGCKCKRSGCLKNYCECFEAQIMCSSICKCIGCKNYEESPERKALMNMANCLGAGDFEGSQHFSPSKLSVFPKFRKERCVASCISWEVVEATCACLLAQGEEAEREHCSQGLAEQRVLEEFGRCLSQILRIDFEAKGLKME